MNWTGGRLQRHSTFKNEALQKQKQHFAAVRQRLQNGEGPRMVPFRPSFLIRDELTLAEGVSPFGQGSQRHTGHPKARQSRLEDYSSIAPLARRLASMRNRPACSKQQVSRHHGNGPSVVQIPKGTIYKQPDDEQRHRSHSSPQSHSSPNLLVLRHQRTWSIKSVAGPNREKRICWKPVGRNCFSKAIGLV